jgi:hypothetical protein
LPIHTVTQSTMAASTPRTAASRAGTSNASSIVVHVGGRSARWRAMRAAMSASPRCAVAMNATRARAGCAAIA